MIDNEIRCGACSRKLGAGEFTHLVIKCPRRGTMNTLRATRPTPERPRASSPERTRHGESPEEDREAR